MQLADAPGSPAPLQDRLPLLVGGGGERRTMRIAAEHADAWHTWATPEEFRRKCGVLDEHCRAVGRDPRDVRRVTGGVLVDVPDPVAEVTAYADSGADEYVVREHREHSVTAVLAAIPT